LKQTAAILTVLSAISLSALALHAQKQKLPLTVERIFANGPLVGTPPEDLSWSPDGKHLTYEDAGSIMNVDPATGKVNVLVSATKLAAIAGGADTEKDKDHRERYKMASYLWSPDSAHLLFNANGHLWLYDLHNGTGVEVGFSGAASGDDPKFSPSGDAISFIRDRGLSVIHLQRLNVPTTVVAPSPKEPILNGLVDWIYEEELDVRSNYFWSPDSKNLAYLQMDETAVPQYPLTDWIPVHATVDMQRYPQPGDPAPAVRVGVVSAGNDKTTWMKLPIRAGEDYIPRFGWADPRTLWIEVLTRDHKHRQIYFANASNGQSQLALDLTDDKFFDEKYDVSVGYGSMVINSWADGHNHLYLYRFNEGNPGAATLERQLTSGNFEVSDVYRVDHKAQVVDYASNEGNVLEQQLWEVNFAGERHALTTLAGKHEGTFAPGGGAFADKHSSKLEPPELSLCAAGRCNSFWKSNTVAPFQLRAPQHLTVKAHDGTDLYASLLLPEGATAAASVPLIVNPYGGPGPQTVENAWSNSLLFDELLAQHGFAVLHADNRGTGGRGRVFAQAAWHNFGPVQLEDQLTVMDAALAQYPQLDPKRLGWWGWSWGGTFTLYALSHSDRFKAGVAVAPVTDWRNYDSIYTERFMGEPSEFAAGYKDFSVVNSAANLKGRLLLVHGTGDDNVHMENTVQYVQKLIEAELPYDLQIYPRKTHSISGPDVRTHLYNRILAHFEQYLKPAGQR
jgi:dipeptidyl-peptidase-4